MARISFGIIFVVAVVVVEGYYYDGMQYFILILNVCARRKALSMSDTICNTRKQSLFLT
jgi:hypothetical protein